MADTQKTEMTVCVGEWVLVPRELSSEALSMLANFDMGSVGDSAEDAAAECWSSLLERAGNQPKELQFQNPVFHSGWNTTVRLGSKWSKERLAGVRIGTACVVVELKSVRYHFNQLRDHMLRQEHDPSCRTVEGLFAEMCRVYPGFQRNDVVTVVDFWLPEVSNG
ncbi:TPA: hypothetical protein ACGPPQ_002877 [Pseudomonas aeruginosa]|uniref:hypothetical protein n=1 Tax=Pseudomonas aeruginosa TaxID=287 RepID=UPI0037093687